MSQHVNHVNIDSFREIAEIEGLIAKHVDSSSGTLTPHRVMECLKVESEQRGLTHLGKLLSTCVGSADDFNTIRWVVFHFDLPSVIPEWDETTTRNWISLRSSEQPLLDEVHRETIKEGAEYITRIYAPSVVAAKMKTIDADSFRRLYEKWWIYCLDCIHPADGEARHRECRSSANHKADILCFNCDSYQLVRILSCNDDIAESNPLSCSLGSLLNGEDETEAARRYLKFAELVRNRTLTEFPSVHGGHTSISCNFYARVPMFFYSEPSRYMTEIFVAFYDDANTIQKIVRLLKQIVPALRICVSLVNSHVAYAIAREARIQGDIQARLEEQAHTIVNNFTAAQLQRALSAENPSETKRIVRDALFRAETLEIAARIALMRGFPDGFRRSILGMLEWLAARCPSAKAKGFLRIQDSCKDIAYVEDSLCASAFTVLWNLWDNAEKVTRYYESNHFDVVADRIDNNKIQIAFRNRGRLPNEWRNFLLGLEDNSPNKKRYTSGLEIVKSKMDRLGWKVSEITVSATDYTTIKIVIPPRKANLSKGGNPWQSQC